MGITPTEVSDNLNIPLSTLRRWAVRFEKLLSIQPGEAGRHRVYTPGDLETFRQIRDLASKGNSLRAIENILTVIAPGQAAPPPEADPETDPGVKQAASGENALMVVAVAGEVGKHGAKIDNLQAQIDKQNKRLAALTEYLSLPWYKRIGKRPPIEY